MFLPDLKYSHIAVIGLGYVGLPLCIEFARTKNCIRTNKELIRRITGFDLDKERINSLKNNFDITGEITSNELKENKHVIFTSDESDLKSADVFIVTVPTPIDEAKRPDIKPIKMACETIGKAII